MYIVYVLEWTIPNPGHSKSNHYRVQISYSVWIGAFRFQAPTVVLTLKRLKVVGYASPRSEYWTKMIIFER